MMTIDLPQGIHIGDSRHMDDVKDETVTLIITSPPYCVEKEYERGMTFDTWIELMRDVMKECDRVLKDGGRACINVASTGRNPYIPLFNHVINLATDVKWWMRGVVLWIKRVAKESTAWGTFKSPKNPILRDNHEFILVFNKGKECIDDGKSGILREEFLEFTKAEWYFSPARATAIGHPAPFPDELPRRCMLLWSNIGDVVLDPFLGSGTTAKVARALERKAIGYELNPEYAPIIKERINEPVVIQSEAWEREMAEKHDHPELCDKSTRELKRVAMKSGIRLSNGANRSEIVRSIISGKKNKQLDDFTR
jgi:site-specific DNA-methyltransferase (adenine-specific)